MLIFDIFVQIYRESFENLPENLSNLQLQIALAKILMLIYFFDDFCIFLLVISYNSLHQKYKRMRTFLMPLLGVTNIFINISGILCVFLFPPYPIVLLCIAFPTSMMVLFIEWRKRHLLIEKKELTYMVLFGLLIVVSVFFLTIGLAILIYLQQVQSKSFSRNPTFDYLMWQQSSTLTQSQISELSIGFYIGNCITLSFYTREYYLMFWVNHFIHIFRILKLQVHHFSQTLLNHLPKIKVTKEVKMEKCCLCIEHYEDFQEVTKVICDHMFHRNCIRLWVVRSNSCPLCRKRIAF